MEYDLGIVVLWFSHSCLLGRVSGPPRRWQAEGPDPAYFLLNHSAASPVQLPEWLKRQGASSVSSECATTSGSVFSGSAITVLLESGPGSHKSPGADNVKRHGTKRYVKT